ncbi:ABC transporter permease subunit [Halococcus hamelinensis]|uniref:Peptide ABC transporter permease n=1 Tax=Halococcus hamelinensis 100A6 TaxID=1132509 RepID=M0LXV6_9EURY|nr:ABC transporter permease subunit [Halococcus hamelinensis]EMA37184.1 peptide ABC transporter permease [Halococcus hamelinensis 100A6]
MAYLQAQLVEQNIDTSALQAQVKAYTNIAPDEPLTIQYIQYVSSALQGDFGRSIWYDQSVGSIVAGALPWSLLLVGVSIALIYFIGIGGGALMAYSEGSRFDQVTSTAAIVLNSIPSYVAGVVFLYFLGYRWRLFPIGGRMNDATQVGLNWPFVAGVIEHLALPVAAFVLTAFGFRALTMRSNSISVLGEEFVRVAQLRGLPGRHIALQYVGRNAVLPLYTGLLISIGRLLGATVIIEQIFRYRGIGYYMLEAINARDYPLMMGCFIVITVTVVLGVYIADLTYRLIDPRADTRSETANITMGSLWDRLTIWINQRLSGQSGGADTTHSDRQAKLAKTEFGTVADSTDPTTTSRGGSFYQFVVVPLKIIWDDWRTRVGLAIVLLYVAIGLFGPFVIAPPNSGQAPRALQAFQNFSHPLGTDQAGRDLLSLLVHATRPMLEMILVGAVFATTVASLIGIVAGYAGGLIDQLLMTLSDVTIAIPGIPLAIVLAFIFQPTDPAVIGLLLTVNAWGGIARQIRSETITIRKNHYVEASQVLGISSPRILYKEVLPNVLSFIMIKFVASARRVIFASVGLYFIGALPYTLNHWGVIMQIAYEGGALLTADLAYWLFIPMATIVVLNYGFILFAQGTDRLLNPRIRAKHKRKNRQPESQSRSESASQTATRN